MHARDHLPSVAAQPIRTTVDKLILSTMAGDNAFTKISQASAHQDMGPLTLAVINSLAVVAAVFIFLRLLSRRLSKTALWVGVILRWPKDCDLADA